MSGQSMGEGAVIMIILIFIAVVLVICGDIFITVFYDAIRSGGYWDTLPADWQNPGPPLMVINLYYTFCVGVAALGVVIFARSVFDRGAADQEQVFRL